VNRVSGRRATGRRGLAATPLEAPLTPAIDWTAAGEEPVTGAADQVRGDRAAADESQGAPAAAPGGEPLEGLARGSSGEPAGPSLGVGVPSRASSVLALTDDALQSLFQLTGAAFPTGAFSHSYGLETVVQLGRVHDLATFGEWLEVHLVHAAGPTDGAAVALVGRAASRGDWETVARVDGLLTALKLAPEVRAASLAIGQAAVRAAREVFPGPALGRYTALLADRRARGNAAVVFGCVAADLRVSARVSVLAFLWGLASALTGVATRLVPLGGIAAQRLLRELQPCIRDAAGSAEARREHELAAATLGQDIAAFRHQRLYSRLYIS
jgi:urease accessory protein